MSTYGYVAAPTPTAPLHPLVYPLKSGSLSTHPVSHTDVPADLVDYLYTVFTRELEGGWVVPHLDFGCLPSLQLLRDCSGIYNLVDL